MRVWVVVVAAGSGTRFGAPKQFVALGGRPVLRWSLDVARHVADGVVVVLPPEVVGPCAIPVDARAGAAGEAASGDVVSGDALSGDAAWGDALSGDAAWGDALSGDAAWGEALSGDAAWGEAGYWNVDAVVGGADSRSGSVRCGLAAVPDDADVVVVHDGARPLATSRLFRSVVDAVAGGADAAIPGVAVADTVKEVHHVQGRLVVARTIDRSTLLAVQTPQAFRAEVLRRVHEPGGEAGDDAALVEAAGGTVRIVPGEPANLKLTTATDLVVAEALVGVMEERR